MKRLYGTAFALLFWFAASLAAASEIPLIEAVQRQDIQRVQMLLQQGADINQQEKLDGSTALHHAAYVDDPAIVAVLLKAGAKVNVTNQLGVTPLILACDSRDPKLV